MEAAGLVRMLGGVPDPDHGLGARDEAGDEVAAGEPALLGDRERRREHRRAGMRAGIGLGQVVELEGMGHGAIRERRGAGMHGRAAGTEDVALAGRAVLPRIGDDHLAPRQLRAVDDRRHRIRHAVLGALHHRRRQILEPHRGGVGGELFGLVVGLLMRRAAAAWALAAAAPREAAAPPIRAGAREGARRAEPATVAICLRKARRPKPSVSVMESSQNRVVANCGSNPV